MKFIHSFLIKFLFLKHELHHFNLIFGALTDTFENDVF